jgi:hypothetical protein
MDAFDDHRVKAGAVQHPCNTETATHVAPVDAEFRSSL